MKRTSRCTRSIQPAFREGILGKRFDSLRIFAEGTGGRATLATNTPWEAVPQIFLENSSYYLIGPLVEVLDLQPLPLARRHLAYQGRGNAGEGVPWTRPERRA